MVHRMGGPKIGPRIFIAKQTNPSFTMEGEASVIPEEAGRP